MISLLFVAAGNPVSFTDAVITAVVQVGQDQWYGIGRELGLVAAVIKSTTASKDTSADKLLAIIDTRKMEVNDATLARELLDVCSRIASPVRADVDRELKRLGEKQW